MKKQSYESMTSGAGWFSITPALSYGRALMMIVGPRSVGKSVSVAIFCLWRYLKFGEKFMYIRRTKDTLELTAATWFTSAVQIMNDNGWHLTFNYDKKNYYISASDEPPQHCGYALPLNAQQKTKGNNYSDCFWLIYDEFIAFIGERYIGGAKDTIAEYKALISLFQTVDRGVGKAYRNETRIIALGNAETFYNPLFIGTGADKYIRSDAHFIAPKGQQWMVQLVGRDDSPASQEYQESIGYQLSDERTKAYAYENQTREQGGGFVRKIKDALNPICNFVWDGTALGMYSTEGGVIYISHRTNYGPFFALSFSDHRPNYKLAMVGDIQMRVLRDAYEKGKIAFETVKAKYCIDNYLKFIV